jgi:hypothetical protein
MVRPRIASIASGRLLYLHSSVNFRARTGYVSPTRGARWQFATVTLLSYEASQVSKLYEQVLGRAPETAGLLF